MILRPQVERLQTPPARAVVHLRAAVAAQVVVGRLRPQVETPQAQVLVERLRQIRKQPKQQTPMIILQNPLQQRLPLKCKKK